MSVITEFTVPAEAFALERTFEAVPEVTVEIERLATHSREWVMPFVWVTGEGVEAFGDALAEDPDVDSMRAIDVDDVGYFNVHWNEDVQQLVDEIVDQHGIMKEAEAERGTWYLKIQFVDQEALEEFQTYFHERGYSFELQRLYNGGPPREREFDLTHEQQEALVTAFEMGYFSIPRETQIDALASELGISTNAVSERLRRATGNLTRNTLTIAPPKDIADAE